MPRRASHRQYFSCTRKFVHWNYWTAMAHAARVEKLTPGSMVSIYPCQFCNGIHVGKQLSNPRLIHAFTKLEKIMGHPNFALKAPANIQAHFQKAYDEMWACIQRSESLMERCQQSRKAKQITSS